MDLKELWQTALNEIELQVTRPNFITWFKNSQLLEKKDGAALIGLPNNFAKEWVENKYYKIILGVLRNLDDGTKKLDFMVTAGPSAAKISESKAKKSPVEDQPVIPELKVDPETNLNPRYTLASFVVGSSNDAAYSAAQAVIQAKDIGKKYNPLFFYGGVGVGKTHLIQAIGNEIKSFHQNKFKVRYVPSEKFTNEVITAMRNKRMETIKEKYRGVDVFIIDDIQFIGGKTRTEEEFFHTFNALHQNNKQIIVSSDKPPRFIPTLEERLRSRFEGGMVCDIGFPDYELRVAVLNAKVQEKGFNLSPEVIGIIANKVRKNMRELEGVLNKISFYQQTKNQEITPKLAESIINESIQDPAQQNLNYGHVVKVVAEFYEISSNDLIGRCRKKEVVEPRQIAMYLLRDVLNLSFPYIGERLGKRDHTTAMYAFEKISQEVNKNSMLNNKIMLIKEKLTKS
ncbi:MAG: chromosomal replication initiator protein DnaA [Candidatus Harrisonbacteria bacterium]|nr:chromosomal replication initiator protein DnaA [Candidatus Harrisonbacteria bacterium]